MSDVLGNFVRALFNRSSGLPRSRDRDTEPTAAPVEALQQAPVSPADPVTPPSRLAPREFNLFGGDRRNGAHTSWSSAMVRSNFLMVSNVGLVVMLAMSLWTQMNHKPTVIIKPPVLTGEIRIEDGLPNKEWMESWALFISHMIGNINPRNVEFVTKQVTSLLSPSLQDSSERAMRRLVEQLRLSNFSQQFEVQDIHYDPTTRMVWVWGYKTIRMANGQRNAANPSSESSARSRWTYEFIIRLNEMGMPVVTHLDQYADTPHFDRAADVTEEGEILEPLKKNNKKDAKNHPENAKEQH